MEKSEIKRGAKEAGKKEKTWHQEHLEKLTLGQKVADMLSRGIGSWPFIISQTIFVIIWMTINAIGWALHWDPYPFILLNLMFSIQAAYAAPIIMMSQNRQNERDRIQAKRDLDTDLKSGKGIEELQKELVRMEMEKLDRILNILEGMGKNSPEKIPG
jgi:uncharacterized membrane protein